MSIGKLVFRTALIGGLAAGAAALLAPDHFNALCNKVQDKVSNVANKLIDDPLLMRMQLKALADELPEKIGELRAEINEVDRQIAQLSHDSEVSNRIVAMTTTDLQSLNQLVAQAEATRGSKRATQVVFHFNGNRLNIDSAKREFKRVTQIRETYKDRVEANERDLGYLTQQRGRLNNLLDDIEAEYNTIESQMWQIDRKIDAIARSERIVESIKDRESTFQDFGRFDVNSLEQLQARLREWELKTEAELEALEHKFQMTNYEREAEIELNFEQDGDSFIIEFDAEELEELEKGESYVLGDRIFD